MNEGFCKVPSEWRCDACDETLCAHETRIEYLGNEFAVELFQCPRCGLVLIPEDLALGKMLEVEQLLEDK